VSVLQVPGGVEQRRNGDHPEGRAPVAADGQDDRRPHHEPESRAAACDGDYESDAGHEVGCSPVTVRCDQRDDARGDR